MAKLGWCEVCKEHSVRVYTEEDKEHLGLIKRKEICINHGHGFIRYLTPIKKEEFNENIVSRRHM